MATQVTMPQMGFDMKEGKVVRWIKREGDSVNRGEALAEIETDKAVVEIEAFASGVLKQIVVTAGTTVPVGQVIGVIAAPEEDVSRVAAGAPEAPVVAPAAAQPKAPAAPPPEEKAAPAEDGRLRASPLAKKEAEARGIDISQVRGSGPGGRITREDVITFAEAAKAAPARPAPAAPAERPAAVPAPVPGEVTPLSRMRQAIAGAMAKSKREIPHFYVTIDVDMTEAVKLRAMLNEGLEKDARISINDMVLQATAKTLIKHPVFNSSYTERGVQLRKDISIGIAIALKEGLIAPAIMDTPSKSLAEIALASRHLAERARSGVLSAGEYTSATFTVTNLGMYGVESFEAIITPPQSAALAVGAVRKTPAVKDGQVVIADMMKATMSIDHRVADGAQAAEFLADLRSLLEKPVLLLL